MTPVVLLRRLFGARWAVVTRNHKGDERATVLQRRRPSVSRTGSVARVAESCIVTHCGASGWPFAVRRGILASAARLPAGSTERMDIDSMSMKTAVIRQIFFERYSASDASLSQDYVTMNEVVTGIEWHNRTQLPQGAKGLSKKNPANFFKDIKRNYDKFDAMWPGDVLAAGYTGVQETGDDLSFRFVKLLPGQTEAATRLYAPVDRSSDEYRDRLVVESLSLSIEERMLVRDDEAFIAQVTAKLRVMERFMADCTSISIQSLCHVLNNAKLSETEIDSVYTGKALIGGELQAMIFTVEVKGVKEDVFADQLVRQVQGAARFEQFALDAGESQNRFSLVVALAVKAVEPSLYRVLQFKPMSVEMAATTSVVELDRQALVELRPALRLPGRKALG